MYLKQRSSQSSFFSAIHLSSATCEHILRHRNAPTEAKVRSETSRESRISRRLDTVYLWSTIHAHRRKCCWNWNSNTLKPDRPQHDRPAAGVIVQQHSAAATSLIMFHSNMGKFGALLKSVIISFFKPFKIAYVWNWVTWYCVSWGASVYHIYRDMDVIWEIKALNI